MNKTKIEWCDRTWNPVVGCMHDCWYCYAKRMNTRFGWVKDWGIPHFFEERLKEPYKLKEDSSIFVCSTADLFGHWVPVRWIHRILMVVKDNPQHTFKFLTKHPARYLEFEFPENCHLGATITSKGREAKTDLKIMEMLKDNYKFISIEPIMSDFWEIDFSKMDQVIVGAMTGNMRGKVEPEQYWITSIVHPNIFYKNNIKKYLNR